MWTEKECCRCKKVKTAEMFHKNKREAGGLCGYCKFCKSEVAKERKATGNRVITASAKKAYLKLGLLMQYR